MSCLKAWMIFLWYFAFLYVRCNFGSKATETITEYIYFRNKQTWQTASRVCQSIEARLFTVTSMQQVTSLVQPNAQNPDVWIGLHRSNESLIWSDAQCSEPTSSIWSSFWNDTEQYSENEKCFRLNGNDLKWHRESCNIHYPFICERYITSDDKTLLSSTVNSLFSSVDCNYIDFKTRLGLVPVLSASRRTCQAVCDSIRGCFMFAPYCDEHCILGVRSTSNSSTQLYKKNCKGIVVSVNESNTDSYQSEGDGKDPLPCTKESLIKEDLDGTLVINCSAVNQSNLTTVTVTTYRTLDVVTPTYLVPCSPSTVVSTAWTTPSPVIETIYITSLIQTVYMTATPMIETVHVTATPTIETVYVTLSPVIETVYMTPSPVIHTVYITTTLPASAMTSSTHVTPSTSATSKVLCTSFNNTNISQEALKEVLEEIVLKLKVDTKTLSTTIRKKKSASDHRRSSTTIGYTAAMMMCVPFVLIVLADVPLIFKHLLVKKINK